MSAGPGRTVSILDELTRDHERIGGLFRDVAAALDGPRGAARGRCAAFDRALRRHMDWEENVLVPALRTAVPVTYRRRTVDFLFSDHEDIRAALDALREEIDAGRRADAAASIEALRVLIEGHNRDEELGIYSDADRHLGAEEKRRIVGLITDVTADTRQ